MIHTRTAWQRSTTERAAPVKTLSPSCSLKVSHVNTVTVQLCLLSGSDVIIKEQEVVSFFFSKFNLWLVYKVNHVPN